MNRLIRIALTLFVSATVLTFLVSKRLQRLKLDIDNGLAEEAARHEGQMIAAGTLISGLLAAAGFVLIIISIARSRRRNLPGP